jgi:cytochrome c-type biogenesis protein CcmH
VFLWLILAALTAFVLFAVLRPLAATGEGERAPEAFDTAVYRDQLKEVESDRARGLIGDAEAEAARIEIARRLLAADSQARKPGVAMTGGTRARAALIGIALALPLLALGLYLFYGSPRLPDQPLAARLEDPANERNLAALVAKVEARLRDHPAEGEGWDVIAPVYLTWQRYADAADAYTQAIRLLGESPKRLSGQGQALVLANNGVVTEEARCSLERALALDPSLIEPRILLAIAKEQDGRYAEAIADWRALLAGANGEVPWRAMVEARIEAAEAHLAGKPAAEIPSPASGGRGPNAGDMAAAENMTPPERQAMIEGMVQRLAARLDRNGSDLPGWLQLVRAYSVLDRKEDARKALERARTQFSGDSQALDQLDRLAAELGLKS